MSNLILAHVVTGLAGIAAGLVIVGRIMTRRRVKRLNGLFAVFIVTTLAACGTGFVFLPTQGVTSAQLVGFFITFLVSIAAYAFYVGRLEDGWNPIYALTVVGVLFLNTLITTTQTFLHLPALNAIAPTEQSPVYVVVKITLLCVFLVVAVVAARRASPSSRE
jgi:magnesium-transporting ATPase (P-type)